MQLTGFWPKNLGNEFFIGSIQNLLGRKECALLQSHKPELQSQLSHSQATWPWMVLFQLSVYLLSQKKGKEWYSLLQWKECKWCKWKLGYRDIGIGHEPCRYQGQKPNSSWFKGPCLLRSLASASLNTSPSTVSSYISRAASSLSLFWFLLLMTRGRLQSEKFCMYTS